MPIAGFPKPGYLRKAKKFLAYNAKTGKFTHKIARQGVTAGTKAGGHHKNGYVYISIEGQHAYAHRLAWWWVRGKWPMINIDHINGKRSDNRIVNLRLLQPSPNGAWRHKLNSNNTSGF